MPRPDFVSPDLGLHLAATGVFDSDGLPDRKWYEESCRRSMSAMEAGRVERDKELLRILDGEA